MAPDGKEDFEEKETFLVGLRCRWIRFSYGETPMKDILNGEQLEWGYDETNQTGL